MKGTRQTQILLALSEYEWSCLRYVTNKFLRTTAGQFKKAATAVVVVELMGEAMTATKHKHQCQACGTIWQHADAISAWLHDEGMEEAHSCPKCSQVCNDIYSGRRSADFEMQLGLKCTRIKLEGLENLDEKNDEK
jgi:hypothetical protein